MRQFVGLLAQSGVEGILSFEKLSIVGVLMLVIWAILTKKLVPGSFYEETKAENEKLKKELDELRDRGHASAETNGLLMQQMDEYETYLELPPTDVTTDDVT